MLSTHHSNSAIKSQPWSPSLLTHNETKPNELRCTTDIMLTCNIYITSISGEYPS